MPPPTSSHPHFSRLRVSLKLSGQVKGSNCLVRSHASAMNAYRTREVRPHPVCETIVREPLSSAARQAYPPSALEKTRRSNIASRRALLKYANNPDIKMDYISNV